jgi:hypothetical protein
MTIEPNIRHLDDLSARRTAVAPAPLHMPILTSESVVRHRKEAQEHIELVISLR